MSKIYIAHRRKSASNALDEQSTVGLQQQTRTNRIGYLCIVERRRFRFAASHTNKYFNV